MHRDVPVHNVSGSTCKVILERGPNGDVALNVERRIGWDKGEVVVGPCFCPICGDIDNGAA